MFINKDRKLPTILQESKSVKSDEFIQHKNNDNINNAISINNDGNNKNIPNKKKQRKFGKRIKKLFKFL